MGYRGHIQKGLVVFDEAVPLPDGTKVNVEPVESQGNQTLADRFKDIIGIVKTLPADMADQHDHYLHGKPKK